MTPKEREILRIWKRLMAAWEKQVIQNQEFAKEVSEEELRSQFLPILELRGKLTERLCRKSPTLVTSIVSEMERCIYDLPHKVMAIKFPERLFDGDRLSEVAWKAKIKEAQRAIWDSAVCIVEEMEYQLDVNELSVYVRDVQLVDEEGQERKMGDYKVSLKCGDRHNESIAAVTVRGAGNNLPCIHGSWQHPHVDTQGALCWGDARLPAKISIVDGRYVDLFNMVESVLRTYNRYSPYVRLCEWEQHALSLCDICGNSYDSEREGTYCDRCDSSMCDGCYDGRCTDCDRTLCIECVKRCSNCRDRYCENCIGACSDCGDYLCSTCATTCDECGATLCPDCYFTCSSCGATVCASCNEGDGEEVLCRSCKQDREEAEEAEEDDIEDETVSMDNESDNHVLQPGENNETSIKV